MNFTEIPLHSMDFASNRKKYKTTVYRVLQLLTV